MQNTVENESVSYPTVFDFWWWQVLGKVYAILSDKEQRAVYDEQGIVDEESDTLRQDRSWDEYWRLLFPKVGLWDVGRQSLHYFLLNCNDCKIH